MNITELQTPAVLIRSAGIAMIAEAGAAHKGGQR